jgi:hypothetical protein
MHASGHDLPIIRCVLRAKKKQNTVYSVLEWYIWDSVQVGYAL